MPVNNSTTKMPHRRVLLTQPSAVADAALPDAGTASSGEGTSDASRPVRVIAYLTNEEAQQLDAVWLQMRMLGIRPSKADIVRAALTIAMDSTDSLGARLKEHLGPTARK